MWCPVCNQNTVSLLEKEGFVPRYVCSDNEHYSRTDDARAGITSEMYTFGNIRVFTRITPNDRDFTEFQLFDPEAEANGSSLGRSQLEFVRDLLSISEIKERVERYKKALILK